jgi:hypothetical protein
MRVVSRGEVEDLMKIKKTLQLGDKKRSIYVKCSKNVVLGDIEHPATSAREAWAGFCEIVKKSAFSLVAGRGISFTVRLLPAALSSRQLP